MLKNGHRHETYLIVLKLTWVLCHTKSERKHNGLHNKHVVSAFNNPNQHLQMNEKEPDRVSAIICPVFEWFKKISQEIEM